jgi:hypothetical protein
LRAGPLSTNEVIETLNRYFVPVTSSNFETGDQGQAPRAEKVERQRIYGDFIAKKLGVGDVHVYILRSDGSSLRGLDIGSALTAGKLAEFLEDVRKELNNPAGPPAFPPHPASSAPSAPDDAMVFHLVARANAGGSWHEFPSENWIVLSRAEWSALLPPEPVVAPRNSWTVPRAVSDKLLAWFYPQTEEISEIPRSRIDESNLRMTVTTVQNGVARARIEGSLKLMHSFYPHKPHDDFVNAQLQGFMDFLPREGRIQRLRLITQKATYVDESFGVALRSVSRETLDAQK